MIKSDERTRCHKAPGIMQNSRKRNVRKARICRSIQRFGGACNHIEINVAINVETAISDKLKEIIAIIYLSNYPTCNIITSSIYTHAWEFLQINLCS